MVTVNEGISEVVDEPKKKYSHLSVIDLGIFPGHVLFAHGWKIAELKEELEKEGTQEWADGLDYEPLDDTTWYGLYRKLEYPELDKTVSLYYLIIPDFNFTDEDYCRLAHEVLHICQFYLRNVLDRNAEFEAEIGRASCRERVEIAVA